MLVDTNSSATPARDVDPIRGLCHDMRQPLAAILVLAETAGSDPQRRLDLIAEQAQWLARLVDDVLVDAASDDVDLVDVTACAAVAVDGLRPTAECRLVLRSTAGVAATARPVALTRAISCLVDNAVRAAGRNGTVAVDVTGHPDGDVSVAVSDDGPGLGQVPARSSLGLSITRALVASFGGSLELRPAAVRGVVATIGLHAVPTHAVAS
jgi:signal transduction histidine kinase